MRTCMHARAVEDEDEDVDEEVAECTHARTDPTERQNGDNTTPKKKHSMYKRTCTKTGVQKKHSM